jgi:ribose/xylose/arabinose/galactoside ABC-type transport system permease subunit
VPVILFLTCAVICHVVLRHTRYGRNVYAVGGNPEAARLSGVDVAGVKMAVLVLSAVLASIGGLILAARLNAGSGTVGADLLLDAIAAVVIGGTSLLGGVGRITGTVLGVLLIASIRNGLVLLNVSAFWQQVAIGALILLAVSVDYLAKGRPKP